MGFPLVAAGITAAGLLGNMSGNGSQKVNQEPMLTEEQKRMLRLLSGVAETGKYNGMTLGEGYGGSLGNYGMTGMETTGQNKLMGLLNNGAIGTSGLYGMGTSELKNMLTTNKFDPFNEKGVYAGYKKNVMKELGENTDILKRNAAVGGNLYSRDTVNRAGDLVETGQDQLNNKLAELYDRFVDRKTGAMTTALNAGMGEESANMARIGASQQYGQLQRNLENQEAQNKYNEWERARKEKLSGLQYGQSVMGTNANFQPTEYPTTSPWSQFFNTAIGIGSEGLGKYLYSA